jgi:thermostable 8-oxoguanine DNA glycosylase
MSSFDVLKEIEYAIKKIVTSSKTRYIMLRAKKLVKANPRLKKYLTPKTGWGLSYILSEYQRRGLIRILETQQGHSMKFYIYVEDAYYDYARQLEQQLQAQAPTPSTS